MPVQKHPIPNLSRDIATLPNIDKDIYVIRVILDSGRIIQPCYIPFRESSSGETSATAVAYYNHLYKGKGKVCEVAMEASLKDAGVKASDNIMRWADINNQLNKAFLTSLSAKGVSASILGEITRNLNVDKNRAEFIKSLDHVPFSEKDKEEILHALKVATRAHRPATSARPQDEEGLFHIPYINHPINVALAALRAGLSANAVKAALLHDVIEDTSLTMEDIAAQFNQRVVVILHAVTKPEGQPRSEFMQHIIELRGEEQTIKGLDRLDNLIRSFGINDPKYAERMLNEDKLAYHNFFKTNKQLQPVQELYFDLHNEIAKVWNLAA